MTMAIDVLGGSGFSDGIKDYEDWCRENNVKEDLDFYEDSNLDPVAICKFPDGSEAHLRPYEENSYYENQ